MNERNVKKWLILGSASFLVVAIILLVAYLVMKENWNKDTVQTVASDKPNETNEIETEEKSTRKWQDEQPSVQGPYADPEIIQLSDGSFKLYYGVEPEQKKPP